MKKDKNISPMTVKRLENTFWLKQEDVVAMLREFAATEDMDTRVRINKLATNIKNIKNIKNMKVLK